MIHNVENFIFDWDGTLADSPSLHAEAFIKVLQENMPDRVGAFRYADHLGQTTREVFARLGVADEAQQHRLTQEKQRIYRNDLALGKLRLFTGTYELLSYLRAQRKKLYIVTGSSSTSVMAGLSNTKIAHFFNGVISADDVRMGKPNPEGFNLCLTHFDLAPMQSIVLEDALHGLAAAKGAGLRTIGLHNANLKDAADFWFASVPDLLSSLQTSMETRNA